MVGVVLGVAIPLDLQLAWGRAAEEATLLQILEQPKAAVNCHPRSGLPSFFSSLHSQARHLQQKRAAVFSDSTISSVAATNVFYGDSLEEINAAVLDEVDAVMRRLVTSVLMEPGDVVLLDTYQVLHGRDVFEGEREHAVVWLAEEQEQQQEEL